LEGNKLACCDSATIAEGEQKLKDAYLQKKTEMEKAGIPHHGRGADHSCGTVNGEVLSDLNSSSVPCWGCTLQRRVKAPLGYTWRDHWAVVCAGYNSRAKRVKEILFDYWADRPAGEDPNDWFYKSYPNDDPDVPRIDPPPNPCPALSQPSGSGVVSALGSQG